MCLLMPAYRKCCRDKCWHYPQLYMGVSLVLFFLVQSALIHVNYVFKDGTEGTWREYRIVGQGPVMLQGISNFYESIKNFGSFSGLDSSLIVSLKNVCDMITLIYPKGEPMLTYGDIPELHYMMNMPPAVSTTYPDLESYPEEQYKEELTQIEGY